MKLSIILFNTSISELSEGIRLYFHLFKFFEEVLLLTRNINYDNGSGNPVNEENIEDICTQGVDLLCMNEYFAELIRNRKIYITLLKLIFLSLLFILMVKTEDSVLFLS